MLMLPRSPFQRASKRPNAIEGYSRDCPYISLLASFVPSVHSGGSMGDLDHLREIRIV